MDLKKYFDHSKDNITEAVKLKENRSIIEKYIKDLDLWEEDVVKGNPDAVYTLSITLLRLANLFMEMPGVVAFILLLAYDTDKQSEMAEVFMKRILDMDEKFRAYLFKAVVASLSELASLHEMIESFLESLSAASDNQPHEVH